MRRREQRISVVRSPSRRERMCARFPLTRHPPPHTTQVDEVLAESTPDYEAVTPLVAAALAALDSALSAHTPCPVDAARVAGLAAALGVPVPERLRWEPPDG